VVLVSGELDSPREKLWSSLFGSVAAIMGGSVYCDELYIIWIIFNHLQHIKKSKKKAIHQCRGSSWY